MLRLFKLTDMPFMHDEFSALFRTRFNSFVDVIKIGVKEGDTHPAGIQIALWLYTKLVGESELLLKIPFVLMGIASIPLSYIIGKKWFNENVGLIVASFIASTQYTLTYSVIIRPYISGLFLGLVMVYFWTLIVNNKHNIINYIGFIIFSSLNTYNHHFSLLFAFIVGISGLFIIPKKHILKYITLGIIIFILYIPHLDIFLSQLNKGGLAWLSKPTIFFPINYLKYVLHFSLWNYLLVLFIFLIGLLFNWNNKNTKFYTISIIWFSIPLFIGLTYSIYINSVIQYSMLLFTFPYLLFCIFGLYPKEISSRLTTVIVLSILTINIYTLITNRQHYNILYKTRHLQFLKDIDKLEEKNNSTILISNHPKINDFYTKRYNWNFEFINYFDKNFNKIGLDSVYKIIANSKTPYFIYGGVSYADAEIVQIIKKTYPYCVLKNDYYASNMYLFSKKNNIDTLRYYADYSNNFKSKNNDWNNIDIEHKNYGAILPKTKEWGPSISIHLDTAVKHRNDVIDIELNFLNKTNNNLYLVTEIKNKDSIINYSVVSSKIKGKGLIYKTIELSGIKSLPNKTSILIYIWNKDKGEFVLENFNIKIRKGNPIQYSLYEPI